MVTLHLGSNSKKIVVPSVITTKQINQANRKYG